MIPNKKKDYPTAIFNSGVSDEELESFIKRMYQKERNERKKEEGRIIDQLSRLSIFDWGGSFQNSLEKSIVDKYVKKLKSYDEISKAIEEPIFQSVRGYTLNSWYNHWSSILIEDIFKEHSSVLPTVGRIEKIDFFINNIPFDLKVTYFPDDLMKQEFKKRKYGVELTLLKKKCRELKIAIPSDLNTKGLLVHLYNKLCEDERATAFIADIKEKKKSIIRDYENNPEKLKVWLYENQGEKRFDASNRLFVILTDEENFFDSWKLKRQIPFLRRKIVAQLNKLHLNSDSLTTHFYWKKTDKFYDCKSGIIFINKPTIVFKKDWALPL